MKKEYQIHGLDCAACANTLEEEIKKIKGVKTISINFINQKMILEYDGDRTFETIKKKIKEIEPEVSIDDMDEPEEEHLKQLIKIIVSLILFLIGILCPFSKEFIRYSILFISYLIVGLEIIIKATHNLFKGKVIEENFLMTIATIGAICIGQFSEAVAVMLFYQIGELFQDWAVDKSKRHVKNLMDIRPDYANVKRNEKWISVNPEEVLTEELILVKPGEKIPLDGVVIKGESFLDTTALTGESIPRKVKVGDDIFNGCINQSGTLEIKVTSEFKESTVSKILNLVSNASNKKAEQEKFITKLAKVYTPIVVSLAFLIAIIPPIITHMSWKSWLYRALAFLVVSCPCALVISIPLSFFAGIGISAKHGILIKGSNYLETLTKVKKIIFDKTGTLTEGVFQVEKIIAKDIEEDKLLRLVSYAEYYSNHPIAISIKDYYKKEIDPTKIKKTEELSGLGIKAKVSDKELLVGNDKLMKKYHISHEESNEIGTVLYIALEKKYVGFILISDKIKKDTLDAIKSLQEQYHIEAIMLTGDKDTIAKSVSKRLNINHYAAELLPHEKVDKMKEWMKNKNTSEKIAFVGDGINDAPVLALSDLGIAMGGIGSDAAIEAADIVIMKDEISKITTAIKIANQTLKIVKENIVFAISVKITILILSVFGIATMWSAVFADVGVSVLAILNSLRLLHLNIKNSR